MSLLDEIAVIQDAALAEIAAAQSTQALQRVRVAVLGKKGQLTRRLRGMQQVPAGERAQVGGSVNAARDAVEAALKVRGQQLQSSELDERISAEHLDISLPGRSRPLGSTHLISRLSAEICEIFSGIGYRVVEGSEAETDYYNFTALNTPPDHPARGFQDTFYLRDRSGAVAMVQGESDVLLRTQTSGVQVHVMETETPPIYILAPGRVYRRDVTAPSHFPQFTQIEGLVVDKGITFGDLKGTLEYLCRAIFGEERRTRFRPHFFPFT